MSKGKRPWKKHAVIEREEANSGDVKFRTFTAEYRNRPDGRPAIWPDDTIRHHGNKLIYQRGLFEDLTQAETDIDTWWADWWPKQIKSRRRA